jgi:hypothetical protein
MPFFGALKALQAIQKVVKKWVIFATEMVRFFSNFFFNQLIFRKRFIYTKSPELKVRVFSDSAHCNVRVLTLAVHLAF